MKKIIIPFITLVIVLVIIIGSLISVRSLNSAPKDSPSGEYQFSVEQGDVVTTVAQKLYSDKVIRSPYSLKIASISKPLNNLQTGDYILELPATAESIITQINEQSQKIQATNLDANSVPTKKVTIREGLTLDQVIDVLVKAKISDENDLKTLANSPDVFRAKYPFLPTPLTCTYGDLSECAKYYLEGYVYPDTYTFVIGSTAQEVYEQMLDNFTNKVYINVKDKTTPDELYRTLTLASVIERETGRTKGVTDATADELAQERSLMADVFVNRTALNIKWQSDPTVTYGTDLTVCQQTFEIDGCVFLDDSRVQTKYNTYLIAGYPIGPTTSPQWSVVKAVLNPEPNDYLFFVSDVTGKKYFAKTEAEHLKNIAYVTDLNEKLNK